MAAREQLKAGGMVGLVQRICRSSDHGRRGVLTPLLARLYIARYGRVMTG
jgi:hypothetical protein